MSVSISICDETISGDKQSPFSLDFLSEVITVRELIRERVYEEVRQHNAKPSTHFRGLVQPKGTESALNGYQMKERRNVDWEKQFELALKSFESNGFFILVDNKQVESLNETILITPATEVSFIKLIPLVGG